MPRIPADQPVFAKQPDVARSCHRRARFHASDVVVRIGLIRSRAVQQKVQFSSFVSGNFQIKVEIHLGQRLQFNRQNVAIPAGKLRQPIVGNDISPPFSLTEVRKFDHRHLGHAKLARCGDTAVASDDAARAVNQNRVRKTKLPDRCSNLRDLFGRMRTGIACVGLQIVHLAVGHLEPESVRQCRAHCPGLRFWHRKFSLCTMPTRLPGGLR